MKKLTVNGEQYANLTAWLETGDCIADRITQHGQRCFTSGSRLWQALRCDFISNKDVDRGFNENNPSYTLNNNNQRAMLEFLPHCGSLSVHLLTLKGDTQNVYVDKTNADGVLPLLQYSNDLLRKHWKKLCVTLKEPLFDKLSWRYP